MVRTLPWLKNGKGQQQQQQKQRSDTPKPKRRRVDGSQSPPPSPSSRSTRSTSAVPPVSSRASTKPTAQDDIYMVAGLANDDGYIMVEDQFLSIAKSFTSTLHSAEYQRRKEAARSAPHAFTNSVLRQTTLPPSAMPAERKIANKATLHKRSVIAATRDAELNTADVSSDEDEERAVQQMLKAEGDKASGVVWAKGALGRLMRTAPTKVERRLAVGKGATKTRAAAGFKMCNTDSPTRSQSQRISQAVPSSPLRGRGRDGSEDLDDYDINEDLGGDDESTDDGSDGLDVPAPPPPPPKFKRGSEPSRDSIATKKYSKHRIKDSPPPPRRREPALPRPPSSSSTIQSSSPPQQPKSILRKSKTPAIVMLSSDDDDMDTAEAERWKRRRQEQQRREAKAAQDKQNAEMEKEKQRSLNSAPVSFLGLKYS